MIDNSYVVSSLGGPSMNMYSLDGVGLGTWEWVGPNVNENPVVG